jgi:hypothetical protein
MTAEHPEPDVKEGAPTPSAVIGAAEIAIGEEDWATAEEALILALGQVRKRKAGDAGGD